MEILNTPILKEKRPQGRPDYGVVEAHPTVLLTVRQGQIKPVT